MAHFVGCNRRALGNSDVLVDDRRCVAPVLEHRAQGQGDLPEHPEDKESLPARSAC
jgi:hypothetical protein